MEKPGSPRRRSAAEWSELLAAWKSSGESATQFASRHGVNAKTLSWWRTKLAKAASTTHRAERKVQSKAAPEGFAEVIVTSQPRASSRLTVVTRSGHRVRVRGVVDPAALRSVLQALESC